MNQLKEEKESFTFRLSGNKKANITEDNNTSDSANENEKRIFLFDKLLEMFYNWEVVLIKHSSLPTLQQYKKIWNKNFGHTQALIDHLFNFSYTYKNNKSLKTEVKLSHEISSFDDKKDSYFSRFEVKPFIHEFDRLYLERKKILEENRKSRKQKRGMTTLEKNEYIDKYCISKNKNNNSNITETNDANRQKNSSQSNNYENILRQKKVPNDKNLETPSESKNGRTKTKLVRDTSNMKGSKESQNEASHNKRTFFQEKTRFQDRKFLNAQIEQTIQTAYRYFLRSAVYAFTCHIEDIEASSDTKVKHKNHKTEQLKTTIEKFNILKSGVDLKLGYRKKDLEGLVTAPRNIIKFLDNLSDCITQVYPEKKPGQLKFKTSRIINIPQTFSSHEVIYNENKRRFKTVIKFCTFLLVSAINGHLSKINSYIVGLPKLILKTAELFYMFLYLHNSERFETLLEENLLRLYPRFILLITVQLFCTILTDIDFCWKASEMSNREKHYLLIFVNEFSIKYLKRNEIVLRNKANVNNAKSIFAMPSADGKKQKTFNGLLLKDPSTRDKIIFRTIKSICSHSVNMEWNQITGIIKGVLEKITGMDRDEFDEKDIVIEDKNLINIEPGSKIRTSILKDENLEIIEKIGSSLNNLGPIRNIDSNERTFNSKVSEETILKSKILNLTKIYVKSEQKDIKDNQNKNGKNSSRLSHLSSVLLQSNSNRDYKKNAKEKDKARISKTLQKLEALFTDNEYNQNNDENRKKTQKLLDSIHVNDLKTIKGFLNNENILSKELENKLKEKKLNELNPQTSENSLKNDFNENHFTTDEAEVKEFFQTYWQPKLSKASKELNLDLDLLLNKKLSEKRFQENMQKVMEHPLVKPMFKKINLDFDPTVVANALGALSLRDNTLLGRRYTYRDLTNPDLSTISKFVSVDEMPTKLKERESEALNIQLLPEFQNYDERSYTRKLSKLQSVLAHQIENKDGEKSQNNVEIKEVFLSKIDFNNEDAERRKEIMMFSHGYLSNQNHDEYKPLKNSALIKN